MCKAVCPKLIHAGAEFHEGFGKRAHTHTDAKHQWSSVILEGVADGLLFGRDYADGVPVYDPWPMSLDSDHWLIRSGDAQKCKVCFETRCRVGACFGSGFRRPVDHFIVQC